MKIQRLETLINRRPEGIMKRKEGTQISMRMFVKAAQEVLKRPVTNNGHQEVGISPKTGRSQALTKGRQSLGVQSMTPKSKLSISRVTPQRAGRVKMEVSKANNKTQRSLDGWLVL